ncbi:hypothetical protein [Vreelandella populi]|uniref:Uncharacterized protein n=1 Tax=Vreelandella populi TaxID=2498858 RepID=A0A433L824_9GAMM|nr:hypothetical protein [Halomonas populi]RUR38444.1 hypothetical protein ELY25_08760 [Halomonas populi]RUR43516.1 hypothetical protein ELY37_17635 [Halomonas populi]RUR51595.1 hypothetical protein ELY40_17560 [Halomonas populi]
MPNSTPSRRIVPDVDQSLAAQHLRHRKGPRMWPLWLAVFILFALLAAVSVGAWLEREQLLSEIHRISGEASNVHARLDSGDLDVQDTITFMQAQMTTLFQEQEQLSIALTNTREEIYGVLTDNEDQVSNDALVSLSERLSTFEEHAELRDRQLTALRTSLDALEQTGVSARQGLVEEVDYLKQNTTQQLTSLEEQSTELRRTLEGQLTAQNDAVVERFNMLETELNTLQLESASSFEEQVASFEQQWSQRITALESDIRQLRQAQLAFSAQIEMLR